MRRTKLGNLACCLAVASLAIRLIVAFLHVPAALAADIQNAGSLAGLDIVICAPGGPSGNQPSEMGGHHEPPLDGEKLAKACPLCLSLAAGDAGLFASGPQVAAPIVAAARFKVYANDQVAARHLRRATARGPPLSS